MKKNKIKVIEHPVISHKLGHLRDKNTSALGFRNIFSELSSMLAYEASRDLKTTREWVDSPIESTQIERIREEVIIAPILRAGEGMLEGFLHAIPFAAVGHIGIYRDRKLNTTVEYYFKMPKETRGKKVYLLDPLLATGDTALAALDRLKEYEVGSIRIMTLLCSRLGIEKIHAAHPDVEIYTLSIERGLNEKGFLVPGVGDAGDRLYHTS